jgi:hypothetical protein
VAARHKELLREGLRLFNEKNATPTIQYASFSPASVDNRNGNLNRILMADKISTKSFMKSLDEDLSHAQLWTMRRIEFIAGELDAFPRQPGLPVSYDGQSDCEERNDGCSGSSDLVRSPSRRTSKPLLREE